MARVLLLLVFALTAVAGAGAQPIPLPEHPRPDFEREQWMNLNGTWLFRFDPEDVGGEQGWAADPRSYDRSISVPFPWGSPLSGVPDSANIAWYARWIEIPEAWRATRVFVVVGASDWTTSAYLDGTALGTHRGGYTPFEFELSGLAGGRGRHLLVFRVDDTPHASKLEGKQGYGAARGIWQTVYLEARGADPLREVHITPSPDLDGAVVRARLLAPAERPIVVSVSFPNAEYGPVRGIIAPGSDLVDVPLEMPGARLWSLEDPALYDVDVRVGGDGESGDLVHTYFGMRSISVERLPGTEIPYVALNGQPVYLQMTLDQAYNPEGYYAFPTDDAIRTDVLRARDIGLNGMRVHVKVGLPRKLYWADRLGMLIMADVPNSWGEPDEEMRSEAEYALWEMIRRDYNHPAIFSWVLFNETWGLTSTVVEQGREVRRYLPRTKRWVAHLVEAVREADPTRLVEDNSVCCGVGHTVTDLNSWHSYRPGWEWPQVLDEISDSTFAGSTWNFEPGYVNQGSVPNINSEFGNVWGYEGSTGDVDWSWDYHRAVNAFRMHPRVAGWLYTEHHDVINEWNGYWRYDRTEKETGLGGLVTGMTLRDLHARTYVVVGDPSDLSREVEAGRTVAVPLWVSCYEPAGVAEASLEWNLTAWDDLGLRHEVGGGRRSQAVGAWFQGAVDSIDVRMPEGPSVAVLEVRLMDAGGVVRHRNFQTFVVRDGAWGDRERLRVISVPVADRTSSMWDEREWEVLDGLKVSGVGSGFFEYRFPWPSDLTPDRVAGTRIVVEASAKQYFDKDRPEGSRMAGDYMRGGGTHSPHRNPNSYPMTDEARYPGVVEVSVNGIPSGRHDLPDDPADHRGILSWHAQLHDGRLREAGSYGYLLEIPVGREAMERASKAGAFVVRLGVESAVSRGLALYGRWFGRYPVDPSVVLTLER